jgi:large subunit ribosomal protein L19e
MVNLTNQRRVAATLLKCGENRVWIDSKMSEEVANAVTRDDIRELIKSRIIQSKQKRGISRARIKHAMGQRKKGKRKGQGSRKGGKYARFPKKQRWISTIRPIRAQLRELRDSGIIERSVYRQYYMYSKGGMFKNRSHLMSHLKAENLLMEPKAKDTKKPAKKSKSKVKAKA